MIDRRTLLAAAAATAAGASGLPARAAGGLRLGDPAPFSFDALKGRARDLAARPYVPPPPPAREILDRIDYDAHGKIKFRTDMALWADGPSDFPVTFFHLGRYFQKPVRMHVVEGASAREITYDDALFDMPADSPAHLLPDNSGFAGFRFQEKRGGKLDWRRNDWVAFLGASYFRAIGELYQYGLSARGLALDTAVFGRAEEFPDFTHVFFETPAPGSDTVVVHALLDGPSVAGAFRFAMRRDAKVTMDVETALHLRQDVSRFGVAPLTSMYWYSEKAKPGAIDWRPEIHDSDGLALWTGAASASGARSTTRPARWPPCSPTRRRAASGSCSATASSTTTSTG
jgi:glucans biosynthesis protein